MDNTYRVITSVTVSIYFRPFIGIIEVANGIVTSTINGRK